MFKLRRFPPSLLVTFLATGTAMPARPESLGATTASWSSATIGSIRVLPVQCLKLSRSSLT